MGADDVWSILILGLDARRARFKGFLSSVEAMVFTSRGGLARTQFYATTQWSATQSLIKPSVRMLPNLPKSSMTIAKRTFPLSELTESIMDNTTPDDSAHAPACATLTSIISG